MIKQILFASAALTFATGAMIAAAGPAHAQIADAASPSIQLSSAMRSVSMGEAMASAEIRAEFGLAGRPFHTVDPNIAVAEMANTGAGQSAPDARLSMIGGFSIAENGLTEIMIADGVDLVRPPRMASFTGMVSDDHDFGNIGYSEVDAFHTDPSPSRIGLRISF